MRTVDTPEPFAPLGAPIRPGATKPQPKPESVAPGIVRDPDGNLRTVIPPPSAPAPALRPMRGRDEPIRQLINSALEHLGQAWEGTEPTIPASAISPKMTLTRDINKHGMMIGSRSDMYFDDALAPASSWPAYSKDYQAGYRDGYAAAMKAKP